MERQLSISERMVTPVLPLWLASVACVSNFVCPGSGTVLAGFSSLCCSKNADMSKSNRCLSFGCSILIGLLQLLLTVILFIGWVWSCVWGLSYLKVSKKFYHSEAAFDIEDGRRPSRDDLHFSNIGMTETVIVTNTPLRMPVVVQPPPYEERPQGVLYSSDEVILTPVGFQRDNPPAYEDICHV